MSDGGRAPKARPSTATSTTSTGEQVSPEAMRALVERVEELEQRVESQQQTLRDVVKLLNDVREESDVDGGRSA